MNSKNLFKIATFALIASVSFGAFAQENQLVDYPELRQALNNDNLVLSNYRTCLDEGHNLSQITVDPVYYIMAPTGDHQAFTVTIVMNRRTGGNYSLQTEYVHIVVQVWGDGNGNLEAKEINVKRSTVY
ncbi:hypothetical protein [Acanthopleuribacter pedis]|uniref:Uncharacterized protein n=1 Tax=Acanthopleuribacter pedis TaxID=442870 RepID=A0A8J7QBC4_9BACT|nr:hypothetical protein [Acanthopleuribacter pedis]MBO1322426.1 hypothetical protein [Acanthopleuribacter pedis]